jgi:hypothetical protein
MTDVVIAEVDTDPVVKREPAGSKADGVDPDLVAQFGGAGPHGGVAADR